ncbi:MAG: DUF547 domain-containing protein [Erythrobacter sp.]
MIKGTIGTFALTALMVGAPAAYAQSEPSAQAGAIAALAIPATNPEFATFTPIDNPVRNRIDYEIWDEAMNALVFRMGKSLRQNPGRPDAGMGSRRIYGHDSRYRLEGNRIMFSFLDNQVINTFTEYRQDLERVGTELDISTLARNEQLAFWINLHNVTVIEQIANAWPVRQPREIEVDGVPMDEAKLVTVKGVSMSLKDIRTQIIYPNWRNPKVIYGFWRGDIGGPSIQSEAYTAQNVGRLLDKSAGDFVNSLRGTQKRSDRLQVSEIYDEARPYYFADWDEDIRTHIASHADDDVTELLQETNSVEAVISEPDIADLAGGVREPSYSNITSDGSSTSFRVPQGMARLLTEHQTKIERMIREGRTGTVTFQNIALPGEEGEAANGEVE